MKESSGIKECTTWASCTYIETPLVLVPVAATLPMLVASDSKKKDGPP